MKIHSLLVVALIFLYLFTAALLASVKSWIVISLNFAARGVAILKSDRRVDNILFTYSYNGDTRTNYFVGFFNFTRFVVFFPP